MAEQHKHKGLARPNGSLRLHPVTQMHKDRYAQQCHTLAINIAKGKKAKPKAKVSKSPEKKPKSTKSRVDKVKELFGLKSRETTVHVDKNGYIFLDLTKPTDVKGVRIKFQRREGRKKRTVGLQIEK